MGGKYDDLLDLPHHVSERHPQMAMSARAAQFMPFASLKGYGSEVEDTARSNEESYEHRPDDRDEIRAEYLESERLAESGPSVFAGVEDDFSPADGIADKAGKLLADEGGIGGF